MRMLPLLVAFPAVLADGGLGEFVNKAEWGEGDESGKVVFMNDEHFADYRKGNDQFLAFFYAPWCGHCKAAKPHYAKASLSANLPMLAFDCTSSGQKTCGDQDVSGYPTIKFFSGNEKPEDYSGGRTVKDFVKFVNTKHDPAWKPEPAGPFVNKPEWGEGDESGNVVFMDDEHFDDYKASTKQFLSFFYAPWCGHCKNAKPHYAKASLKTKIPMVAMDCTASGSGTCSEYGVNSFPTIKFFDDGEPEAYTGGRQEDSFVSYLEKKDPDYVAPPYTNIVPEAWTVNMTNGNVFHLGDEHYEEFTQKHERMIGFFYAPWCGHCKRAKPDLAAASTRFRRGMAFVAFDCTSEAADICRRFNVTSYPTVKYIEGAKVETLTPDSGGWGSGDFISIADKKIAESAKGADGKLNFKKMRVKHLRKWLKARGLECKGCAEKRQFIKMVQDNIDKPEIQSKKHTRSLMEEKRHKEGLERTKKGWSDESYGNGAVKHFADQGSFDKYLKEDNKHGTLAMFYAPWCGHCKTLKPLYVEASEYINANGKGVMAAVDAEFAKEMATKYGISSYPTLKYFPAGTEKAEDTDLQNKDDLIEFMMRKGDSNWEKPPVGPFVNNPEWGDDSGDVIFMDDDHFEEYKDEQDMFLAFFYAPWCGHCKAAKPHYGKASKRAPVPFVAMDCTGSGKATCNEIGVKGYPTLKWFADDDFEDYQGGRGENDFLQFVKSHAEDLDEEEGPGLGSSQVTEEVGEEEDQEEEEEEEEEIMRKDEL